MQSNTTIEYLHIGEFCNPEFQEAACDELFRTIHTTNTTPDTLTVDQGPNANGVKTSWGKGGGTVAHSEIAGMFQER